MFRFNQTGVVFVLTLLASVNTQTTDNSSAISQPTEKATTLEDTSVNVVHSSDTSPVQETTDDGTSISSECTNDTKCSTTVPSPSDVPRDPARQILPILQQVVQYLPDGLKSTVNRMEPLDDNEIRLLNNYVQGVKAALDSLPESVRSNVTDVLKAIEETGIFDGFDTPQSVNGTIAPSDVPTDPARQILPILQQVVQFLPEGLKGAVNRMEPLDENEVRMLMQFVQGLEAQLGSLPENVRSDATDLLKAIEDTGILDSLNITQSANGEVEQPIDPLPPHTHSWPRCQLDILIMLRALNNTEMWALTMIDAMGKPAQGILKGNLIWLGNNDECTSVHYKNGNTLSDIRGRTCRTSITLDTKAMGLPTGLPRPITWDVCMPDSCESWDLNLALYERSITNVYWQCTADLDLSSDTAAIIAMIILATFAAMLVVGSLIDVCLSFNSNNTNKPQDNYIIGAYSTSTAYNDTINEGFELRETDLTTPSTIEVPMERTTPAIRPLNENGVVLTRLNGKRPVSEIPEIPDYNDYRAPNDLKNGIVHNERHQMQQLDQRNKAKGNDEASLPRWQRALLSFSIQRNTGKIFSVDTSPGTIGCLHGIRVLSLAWVILGHVIIFGALSGQFENSVDINSRIQTLPFQIIVNGPLSVDTFFFMSGFLTCYLFLKECAKGQKVTVKQMVLYYVHRYWRLTPPLMIWVMIEAVVVQYVGEGRPGWVDYSPAESCRKNWWANLLYINSVYTDGGVCVGVSWFLSNDMMYYFIAPLVLIPWVYRQRLVGFAMVLVLLVIHVSTNAWLITKYNFDILRQPERKYDDKLYFKPYTRVAPFAIGLVCGYVMHRAKGKIRMDKWMVFLGWLLALGTIFTLGLVTYDENGDLEYAVHGWSAGGKAAYETIARPMWAVAIGWMVIACASGYGGFINSFLAWPGWQPLSRLTYGAYLVHLTVMGVEMSSIVDTYLFTDFGLIYLFVGYYFISYVVGYLLCITVESPMLGLEKAALK